MRIKTGLYLAWNRLFGHDNQNCFHNLNTSENPLHAATRATGWRIEGPVLPPKITIFLPTPNFIEGLFENIA
jgi:hypothetical protein